jgi:D-alanyl-D-alanine carboxypeptidase
MPPIENNQRRFRLGITMLCVILLALVIKIATSPHTSTPNLKTLSTSSYGKNTQTIPKMNMQVLSPTPGSITTSTTIKKIPPGPAPESIITATSYLVGNADTGEIYLSKNINKGLQIASISKLFTALAAEKHSNASTTITITEKTLEYYPDDPHKLTVGDSFTIDELLYPLILESNNNVAQTLASTTGYTTFLGYMGDVAKDAGLNSTRFEDSSGLGDGNISTAADLFKFGQYLYHSTSTSTSTAVTSTLLSLTSMKSKDLPKTAAHGAYIFKNTSVFVGDPNYIGGKTGRSDSALETMLSIFNYDINGKKYPLVIVVLHSSYGDRQGDSEALYLKTIEKITGRKTQ